MEFSFISAAIRVFAIEHESLREGALQALECINGA